MAEPEGWVSVSTPYVTPRSADDREAWADEASRHGRSGTQRLIEVREVRPPRLVAEALDSGEDLVVVRRRVMLLDDQPVELVDSYYPGAIARMTSLADPRRIRGGAVSLLAELGYPARRASEDVYAREAAPEEQTALRLGEGAWVLILFRLLTSDGGVPIEASVMTAPARTRRLRYELAVG
ncbi:MAG TPA: UTRA domain-containing protein [Rugosimonospora sp.]|nr:UTRA domain-containing protein [Rugosimonospora sp.]